MTSVTRTGFCMLLTIALICNVKPYVGYDLKIRDVYRVPSSELAQSVRGSAPQLSDEHGTEDDTVPSLETLTRNGYYWQNYQDEDVEGFKPIMVVQLMKIKNKEEQKRGVQALAKNGDFPKKITSRGLEVFVTNYTFPSDKQYPY